jgi:hypothetical protein
VCGLPSYHAADRESITNPRLIVEVPIAVDREPRPRRQVRGLPLDRVVPRVRPRAPRPRIDLRSLGVSLDVDTLYEGAFAFRSDEP